MKKILCFLFFILIFCSSCENVTLKSVADYVDNKKDNDSQINNDNDPDDQYHDEDDISEVPDIEFPDMEENDLEEAGDDDIEEDDTSSFIPIAVCGNGKVEGNEVCDGNSIDCTELGFTGGTAHCKSDCSGWSTGGCLRDCEPGSKKCDGSSVMECVNGQWSEAENCSETFGICRGGRCMDPSETDSRLDFEGPSFSGDKVLVYHYSVNGEHINSSGTLTTAPTLSPLSTSYSVPEGMLRSDLRPPVPEHLGVPDIIKNRHLKMHEPVKSFSLGDKDTFYVYDFGSGSNRAVTATLRNVGTYCEIWVEDGSTISNSNIQSIVDEFDSVIYYLVTDNFYDVADIDGNGVVSIFIGNLGGYAAGYITWSDFYTKQEYSQSNFRDLMYIERSMQLPSMKSTIVHEFQHLVHANRNLLIEGDWNSGNLYYRWIDEGLAMAAQHMYEGAQTDKIYILNHSSYNGPTRDGNSFLYWDYYDQHKVYSDYAMAYVFIQYLRIQSGNKTSIYREIIECLTNDYRCVENIVTKYVHPEYNLNDFIVDFRLSLILQDDSGPYSFGGESAFKFNIPAFTGSQVNLRGGGGVFINSPGTFIKPSNAGSNIIFIGIDTTGN